ncbi:ependymin-like isoform X2 [Acanthochromis polyacanthus]|uniref:ependymin-like isoform X2 n=1 Tax=Acanthochromis polyacanthus TaxID=80966 RepID=UPI002234A6A0|nr:ependymin-like isoform X2 [Acanthochromis polyacanthus]
MYAAVILLVFMCLTATTHADHHQQKPCHLPNATGVMNVMDLKDPVNALGEFTYDSTGNKLRFRSYENFPNASRYLDLLMFFEEGILYEINSKNQSCEKKKVQHNDHILRIPKDAQFLSTMTLGNPSAVGEGLEFSVWTGSMADNTGKYVISVTKGCLPLSSTYYGGPTNVILFSFMNLQSEIKNPEVLEVPSFCEGLPVEETVNRFLEVLM